MTSPASSPGSKQWWKTNSEVWLEPHTQEEFWKALAAGAEDIVFVEYFATWCEGCKTIYPTLCSLAGDKEWKGRVKFVKVCVDEHKQFSKDLGVKALPFVQLYKAGESTELVGFQAVPSRSKAIRGNLKVVLDNPGKWFRLDPNGFVVVSDVPPPDAQAKAKRAAQLDAMRQKGNSLFDHLMKVANSSEPGAGGNPAPAAAPVANGMAAAAAAGAGVSGGTARQGVEASPELEKDKSMFLTRYRREYGYEGRIDDMYAREIGVRLPPGHHYLDYTGSSLYCNSTLQAAVAELQSHVFGNPHSDNPSSVLSTERVEEMRDMVRQFFNAPASDYQVVFTASATGSLKLVGETFPWTPASEFRYLRVNHNSVLGIRQYALEHDAQYTTVEEDWVEDWVKGRVTLDPPQAAEGGEKAYSLFAFPAEDNFAGVKYPLKWVQAIQAKSTDSHEWKVLVDAAAYVPTQPLDLSATPADFVSISFYKMFGYPTGLGALLIRTENVDLLKKVFWGGGSVSLAVARDNFHVLKCEPAERLEDGTVAFLDIIALRHGFELLKALGGMTSVQAHVACLTQWLYSRMKACAHSNQAPMFHIFGKHGAPNVSEVQGGIVNFELLQPDGSIFSYRTFQKESADAGFHLRTGSECNPGACYLYVGIKEEEVETLAGLKEGCNDDVEWIQVERPVQERRTISSSSHLSLLQGTKLQLGHEGEIAMKWVQKPLGTIRVSLGYMSTFEDVHALVTWMQRIYKDRTE